MKKRLGFAISLGLLSACSGGGQPADTSASQPEVAQTAPPTAAADCRNVAFESPLPEGISLAFPFHFRSDRLTPRKDGQMQRQVVLEITDGDLASDFKSAQQSLASAGYSPSGELKGDLAMKQSQKFKKKGAPTIYLKSNADVGSKPSNPRARAVIYFEWTLAGERSANPIR